MHIYVYHKSQMDKITSKPAVAISVASGVVTLASCFYFYQQISMLKTELDGMKARLSNVEGHIKLSQEAMLRGEETNKNFNERIMNEIKTIRQENADAFHQTIEQINKDSEKKISVSGLPPPSWHVQQRPQYQNFPVPNPYQQQPYAPPQYASNPSQFQNFPVPNPFQQGAYNPPGFQQRHETLN